MVQTLNNAARWVLLLLVPVNFMRPVPGRFAMSWPRSVLVLKRYCFREWLQRLDELNCRPLNVDVDNCPFGLHLGAGLTSQNCSKSCFVSARENEDRFVQLKRTCQSHLYRAFVTRYFAIFLVVS